MIVVFVIDTSPSMGQPLVEGYSKERSAGSGMSRLDLAKMAVEDVVRGLTKRVGEHNVQLQQQPQLLKSLRNLGLGFSANDEFLLLSTGRQHAQQPATAACGAGGRLLVGYGDRITEQAVENPSDQPVSHVSNTDSFQRELKRLQASVWVQNKPKAGQPIKKTTPFPEDGGGAVGLNAALSAGLQLLSRYRLSFRSTENFGMGRLPSLTVLNPSGGPATNALQPACLILITDGVCLRSPPAEGGGSLQLQPGNMPLREFYKEPFRWDQRIFCLGVGARENVSSTQYLHPQLRALCEVTGGSHMMLRSSAALSQVTDLLLKLIAPPRPRDLPLADPLRLSQQAPVVGVDGTFVSGGPVCCFQALEGDLDAGHPTKHRAMLLYVPHQQAQVGGQASSETHELFQPPIWCIPEAFFPSKKLDTLPPRQAQPNLLFVRYPARLGSKTFEAISIIKALHRLDQLVLSNRKAVSGSSSSLQVKLLPRDVYICEWVSLDGKPAKGPLSPHGMEYFPVIVPGAGRPTLSEGEDNYFNVGILHVPSGTSTLASSLSSGARLATLTLLPPEPQILLPLLIRAAEAEHRAIKKASAAEAKEAALSGKGGSTAGLIQKQAAGSRSVHLDEHWRTEFRAYLFRLPPYYQNSIKRGLRTVLPTSVHSILNADGMEGALATQCFSKACLQKIRNGEQIARETHERLERQEAELRRRGMQAFEAPTREQHPIKQRWPGDHSNEANRPSAPSIGYGQYDPRSTTDTFLAALRNMPAPWRVRATPKPKDLKSDITSHDGLSETASIASGLENNGKHVVEVLGDLPASCLMAYYESRRRWIFGGSGLTTRGLFVEGVHNDGSNVQHCAAKVDISEQSLLSLAGVGVMSTNATTTTKMGDYRERLLWSRAPVVGYGSNDASGVSATNAANGAPIWSVDDDAMPISFFDPRTGEFSDSVQSRVRSRLMVNFGNPYKDKRADSLIPEKFLNQCPSMKQKGSSGEDNGPRTPPGSPPHDSFSAIEGEGEAVFAGKPLTRKSPTRKSPSRNEVSDDKMGPPDAKRQKVEQDVKSDESLVPEKTREEKPPSVSSKAPITRPVKAGSARGHPPPPPPKGPPKKPPPPRNPSPRPPRPSSMNTPPPRPSSMSTPPPKPPPSQQGQKPPPPQQPSPGNAPAKRPPPPRPNVPPKPANFKHAPPQQQKKRLVQPPAPQSDMQSPNKKPNVDLPPGWMCVWSKSQKRWYFFDTKTNKSVWQWPPPGGLPK